MGQMTTATLRRMKKTGQKVVMVTAYDFPSARLADQAGVDQILVGDSLGMAVLGYQNTLAVTMEDMLHHTRAVVRGTKNAMVVTDMPFMSYQVTEAAAVSNAGRLVQEAGAQAVKLEGGAEHADIVAKIVTAGIPVVGHLGFTPQSIHQFGGAFFQGKTVKKAVKILEDALRLEDAGICSLVLELVPWEVAEAITARLTIPTIGIGSGPACDGQVLVYHDLLGFGADFQPKHNKSYAQLGPLVSEAIQKYSQEVRSVQFPEAVHTKRMEPEEYALFCEALQQYDRWEENS